MRFRLPVRAGVAIACLGAAALQIPGLLATTEIKRSQAAQRAGHPGQALAWARDAAGAEPWSASAYLQRGLVLESVGQLPAAAHDVERAISHERTNFANWLVLARIQTERGFYTAAANDYDRARRLRPQGQVFQLAQLVAGLSPAPAH